MGRVRIEHLFRLGAVLGLITVTGFMVDGGFILFAMIFALVVTILGGLATYALGTKLVLAATGARRRSRSGV